MLWSSVFDGVRSYRIGETRRSHFANLEMEAFSGEG
jgi:hypothetical protein